MVTGGDPPATGFGEQTDRGAHRPRYDEPEGSLRFELGLKFKLVVAPTTRDHQPDRIRVICGWLDQTAATFKTTIKSAAIFSGSARTEESLTVAGTKTVARA